MSFMLCKRFYVLHKARIKMENIAHFISMGTTEYLKWTLSFSQLKQVNANENETSNIQMEQWTRMRSINPLFVHVAPQKKKRESKSITNTAKKNNCFRQAMWSQFTFNVRPLATGGHIFKQKMKKNEIMHNNKMRTSAWVNV